MPRFALLALSLALLLGQASLAAVFEVDFGLDAADDAPGDGVCASLVVVGPPVGTPPLPQLGLRCTLRGALQEANALPGRDEVLLPTGSFQVSSLPPASDDDVAALGDLDVLDDVEVRGAGIDATTVAVSGGDGFHDVTGASLELRALTLAGDGTADAVRSATGSIELEAFRGRDWATIVEAPWTATEEVAVSALDSELLSSGFAVNAAFVDLDRVVVDAVGTGVVAAQATIRRSILAPSGVGVFVVGDATIESSTVRDSASTAVVVFGALELRNSTLSGNRTALGITWGPLVLEHATIADSLEHGVALDVSVSAVFDHSIVYASGVTDCDFLGSHMVTSTHSLDGDGTCELDDPTDLPGTDPLLLPLADRGGPTPTHGLAGSSPARNGGAATCNLAEDQRGEPRPTGPACDIGAFEAPANSCGLGFELAGVLPLLLKLRGRRAR